MRKILRFSPILLAISLCSCSTLNKTLLYSSIGGAIIGGFMGKELSPDRESDNFNTALGGAAGATISAAIGYYFYKDANPSLDLEQSPLKNETPLPPIIDHSYGMDKINIMPKVIPKGDKEYLQIDDDLPEEYKNAAKKQYFKRYKSEPYIFEQNGKTYRVPSFEIIENGVE